MSIINVYGYSYMMGKHIYQYLNSVLSRVATASDTTALDAEYRGANAGHKSQWWKIKI